MSRAIYLDRGDRLQKSYSTTPGLKIFNYPVTQLPSTWIDFPTQTQA